MHLVNIEPDICYAMNTLSQFMFEPHEIYLVSLKHILRYLQGTIGYELKYENTSLELHGYIDFD